MELTNELKLLLIQTEAHTDAQTVINNITNTAGIDTDAAWTQRLDKFIKDKNLGSWSGTDAEMNKVYTEPTAAELKTSLEANPFVPLARIPIWELEKYESEADYDAKLYARNRKSEYPAMEDQLDKIFHDGIDAWKSDIQAVKDKYPKG